MISLSGNPAHSGFPFVPPIIRTVFKEPSMDTDNLRYFAAVARCGSINRAAAELHISQPQLSHIIQNIEAETGLSLFVRTSRGSRLTREGERFLAHCAQILDDLDNLTHFINQVHSGDDRLAISMTRFSHIGECFSEVCRRHEGQPGFTFRLREGSPENVFTDISEGYSRIGVLHYPSRLEEDISARFREANLDVVPLASFQPYICLSSRHELLSRNRTIDLDTLSPYGFVRYIDDADDSIYQILTNRGIVDLSKEASKVVRVNDRMAQIRLIAKTNFFTVGISEFLDQDALHGVVSVPLLDCPPHLSFCVITKADVNITDVETEFIDTVRKKFRLLMEQARGIAPPAAGIKKT